MGGGNHSLTTANEYYEQLKAENPGKDMSHHPARYALVEIVNLHSPALEFEAIHRIVTGVDTAKFMAELTEKLALSEEISAQSLTVVDNGKKKKLYIHNPSSKTAERLTISTEQRLWKSCL